MWIDTDSADCTSATSTRPMSSDDLLYKRILNTNFVILSYFFLFFTVFDCAPACRIAKAHPHLLSFQTRDKLGRVSMNLAGILKKSGVHFQCKSLYTTSQRPLPILFSESKVNQRFILLWECVSAKVTVGHFCRCRIFWVQHEDSCSSLVKMHS